jgi:hypothetical protein
MTRERIVPRALRVVGIVLIVLLALYAIAIVAGTNIAGG